MLSSPSCKLVYVSWEITLQKIIRHNSTKEQQKESRSLWLSDHGLGKWEGCPRYKCVAESGDFRFRSGLAMVPLLGNEAAAIVRTEVCSCPFSP